MNALPPSASIRLETIKQESLVDSRIIAVHLGNHSRHTMKLIRSYELQLNTLGVVRFQIAKPIKGSKGGRPETYALLNENQCYFLLTLCANSEPAVALKLKLVTAFKEMRESLAAKVDYLPCYRECHDAVSQLVGQSGSTTAEYIHHMNIEKMINRSLGIPSGERKHLPPSMRSAVSIAERLAGNHYLNAMEAGEDHKSAYIGAKSAVALYADTVREALPMPEASQ
ncbi:MAG: Rha family transcriptional regulator [Halopseudomonas sp.]